MEEKVKVVDVWVNPSTLDCLKIWPAEMVHVAKLFGMQEILDKGIPIEETVRQMEEAGVEIGVLSAAWGAHMHLPNDVVAEFIRRYPGRFIGSAAVSPMRPMEAVREVERAVKDLGMRAVRLFPYGWDLPFNDKRFYPIFTKCCELGVPVLTQVGHTAPTLPSEPGRPIYLDQVALHFPELKIVGCHIGWPWTEEMVAIAWKHPNVYIDTSAHLPKYYPPALLQFLKTWGQDKVLFASDYPLLPFDRCIRQVDELGLTPEVKRKFLRENAMRVFSLDEKS